jgi:predicted nucleic acid-binding protein
MSHTDSVRNVGLDTSVVLRLITGEPSGQAKRALLFLAEMSAEGRKAVVSDLVVTEAYFALRTHYGVPKHEAIKALLAFAESGLVTMEVGSCATGVMRAMIQGSNKSGFVDRLIHAQYVRGAAQLTSFEAAARKLADAVVLEAM